MCSEEQQEFIIKPINLTYNIILSNWSLVFKTTVFTIVLTLKLIRIMS